MSNIELNTAKKNKMDEFYTSYEDIELEMKHYIECFMGKVIYMNCDNPETSNFWKYFYNNFDRLKLKKIICTYLSGNDDYSYRTEFDGSTIKRDRLNSNGDFRNDKCVEILKEADIVVTNPPFSLFREFMSYMITYQKQFIVLGNINAVKYTNIFPLIRENKIFLGFTIHSGDRKFYVPDNYGQYAAGVGVDENGKYIKVKGVRWFENVKDNMDGGEFLITENNFDSNKYNRYDNYDAINCDRTKRLLWYNGGSNNIFR